MFASQFRQLQESRHQGAKGDLLDPGDISMPRLDKKLPP